MAKKEQDDLAKWFNDFHTAHPHVYEAFKAMALEIKALGHKRYGAKTIMERLRWESTVRHPGQVFKLSNDIKDRCSARYARLLIAERPAFAKFFTLRPVTSAAQRARLSQAHRGGAGRVNVSVDWGGR